MRIAVLTPYYTPIIGGITTFTKNLSEQLKARGFDVFIITNNGKEDEFTFKISGKGISYNHKCKTLLKKINPDVIHAHAHWYTLPPALSYKRSHKNTKVVFTFHTEPASTMRGFKKRIFGKLLSKCDHVTFVSKALEKKIENNIRINTKKSIVYTGAKLSYISRDEIIEFKKCLSAEDRRPIISFIGPLEWELKAMGVMELVRSIPLVLKKHPKTLLIIAGDGKYKTNIKQLSEELDIAGKVKILSYLKDVSALLEATDIYAHISLQEGLPIALLEAMQAGKPVIATAVGGIPEVIVNGKNGILVEFQPEKIATEIIALASDHKKMEELSKAAVKTAGYYTWEKMADDFIKLYRGGNQNLLRSHCHHESLLDNDL